MSHLPTGQPPDRVTLGRLRQAVLVVFLFGALGIATELFLIGHTQGLRQLAPLLSIALSIVLLALHAALRRPSTLRALQAAMLLLLITGTIGLVLHYRAKMAFKLETDPSLAGMALLRQTIQGSTLPPILAPGAVVQLGLLGLAFTYRNPAPTVPDQPLPNSSQET
jgi:NO-binding membrane sensor protein with MHYT domain